MSMLQGRDILARLGAGGENRSSMYGVPADLDLSPVVGEFTTQIRVGQFDLQFTFGSVNFAVQSPVSVLRDGTVLARWAQGSWPEPGFFDVLNASVLAVTIGPKEIALGLENGLTLQLIDDSDQYETMQINAGDGLWVI
ncbi:MAG: hypothetical protein AAGD18_19190 [Actinomycetota bacterium]